MLSVRKLEESDYPLIESWWQNQTGRRIWRALLPNETTFVVTADGVPVVSACLYLMNVPDACMMENLIGNPEYKGSIRKEATSLIFNFLELEAKRLGYTTIVLFSYENRLKSYYEGFGYQKTMENVTTYAKQI